MAAGMSPLHEYNKAVESAVDNREPDKLRDHLLLSSDLGARAMHEYVVQGGACPSARPAPWASLPEMVARRHKAAAAVAAHNWVEAYSHAQDCLTGYLASVLANDDGWSLPVLYGLCGDLREVAFQADAQLVFEGRKAVKMDEAARILQKAFTATSSDQEKGPKSKRVGTLECVNQLFRVYFQINALRLCTNLMRVVSAPNALDFDEYPAAHRVTYKYYVGRLHLYEDRCEEAVECLQYALDRIPKEYEVNRRRVLLYLIPAKILRGSTPSLRTLARYNMTWYTGVVKAVRSGNLSAFDDAVTEHEQFFIRKGLYLVLEKMRSLVYRSLCQKLHQIRVCEEAERHKIKLREYQVCLQLWGVTADEDEVECILANLIYNGLIKGYLSHKVRFLVLSTKQPFPPLQLTKS